MNYIKNAIYGPDPAEQKRKCKALLRKNQRELDKQIGSLGTSESKTKTMIKQVAKRNDTKSARMLAMELYKAKKQKQRLYQSKAQLNSVGLQIDEAFALRKIEGTMKSSTGIMKDMNTLIKMPELMGTMNALGQELVKAGIIDEMITDTLDTLDENDIMEDSEVEDEVDAILTEITGISNKKVDVGHVPEGFADEKTAVPAAKAGKVNAEEESEDEEEDEEMLNKMRERLKALQS